MNCYKIVNDFWRLHHVAPFSPVEFAVFHYIVRRYDVGRGVNPIAIPTRDFETRLLISRNQLVAARRVLQERGLITFVKGTRTQSPVYTLVGADLSTQGCKFSAPDKRTLGVPDSAADCVGKCVEASVSNNDTISTISKESNMSKYSREEEEKIKKTREIFSENNVSDTDPAPVPSPDPAPDPETPSVSEKSPEMALFDRCADEIRAGRHDLWCAQMAKKHHIAAVADYLAAFRSHVICNSSHEAIRSVSDFKRYFNLAFRYFSVKTPEQQLDEYEASAPASSEKYRLFCRWLRAETPYLARTLDPLSERDFDVIFGLYPKSEVFSVLRRLNDHPATIRCHRTMTQPIIDWFKRKKHKEWNKMEQNGTRRFVK